MRMFFRVLRGIVRVSDAVNGAAARAAARLLPLMTAVMIAIIIGASAFRVGRVWMSELVVYMHAVLFMTAAAHTLRRGGHVRIDMLYGMLSPRGQAWADLAGTLLLLLPTCAVIFAYSMPYIASSWAVLERSPEGGGLPAVFLLKTVIAAFAAMMILEGLSLASRSALFLFSRSR